MTYQPKEPRRVILAARVEPEIKEWLKERFPESISHGVNYILALYMAKHAKGDNHANGFDQPRPLTKEQLDFQRWAD